MSGPDTSHEYTPINEQRLSSTGHLKEDIAVEIEQGEGGVPDIAQDSEI